MNKLQSRKDFFAKNKLTKALILLLSLHCFFRYHVVQIEEILPLIRKIKLKLHTTYRSNEGRIDDFGLFQPLHQLACSKLVDQFHDDLCRSFVQQPASSLPTPLTACRDMLSASRTL